MVIAGSASLGLPAILSTGAAQASATACVSVLPGGSAPNDLVNGAPVVDVGTGGCGSTTSNTSAAAVNVCSGTSDDPDHQDYSQTVVDASSPTVAGAGEEAFAYFDNGQPTSPAGELEVYGAGQEAGVGSQQTGC